MEEDILNYLPTVMFRGTLESIKRKLFRNFKFSATFHEK